MYKEINYPYSCELGAKHKSHNQYDCRIMSNDTIIDRVLVYALNFEQVKWCMIGYTKKELNISKTSVSFVKRLIVPSIPQAAGVCGAYLAVPDIEIIVIKQDD